MLKGQVRKAISGFYYIYAEDGQVYQTRGRGIFRKEGLTPLVGDYVSFSAENKQEGRLEKVAERKNQLDRPPVANVDMGMIIMSAVEPDFSAQLLDRFLVQLYANQIQPVVFITKIDLASQNHLDQIEETMAYYQSLAIPSFYSDNTQKISESEMKRLDRLIQDKTVVFIGQSGAGKSTLLNKIDPSLDLNTGEISQSLGRGRHTTRHVELIPILSGLIADTPGFSSLQFQEIEAEELRRYFPDFLSRQGDCKFRSCLHKNEPKCAVKEAVTKGEILESRYNSYLLFLKEIEERKPFYPNEK